VVAPLAVVDQSAQVEQMSAVLSNGAGNQLARLCGGERRTFF
jgi:hypothetical protein